MQLFYPFVLLFDRVYDQYHKLVFQICYKVLQDREYAKDAAQETFMMVYKHRQTLEEIPTLKSWVCKTAHSKAVDIARKNNKPVDLEPDNFHFSIRYVNPEQSAIANECIREVLNEIQNMNPCYVKVLEQYVCYGLKAPEIARMLDIPLSTVKSRINRGLKILRDRVANRLGGMK